MKVLHLISGLNSGGAEGVLYRILSSDRKYKHIVVCLGNSGFYANKIKKIGLKLYVLNTNFFFFFRIFKIFKILIIEKPVLIQSWMYHADFLTILIKIFMPKINIFWNIRNSNLNLKWAKLSTIFLAYFCAIFSYLIPKTIICCSNSSKKTHAQYGYCKKKLFVIYNGFDFHKFKYSENLRKVWRKKLNIKKEDFVLGMFARWHPQKNFKLLVQVFNKLQSFDKTFRLLLVGKNIKNNKSLSELVGKNKKNVILKNEILNINEIYNTLDLFVLLSKGNEGFPNVLAEAMLTKVLCISSNQGDAKRIIGNFGWLTKNEKDLYSLGTQIAKIKKLYVCKKKYYKKKQSSARNHIIKNFNLNLMIKKYQEAWGS